MVPIMSGFLNFLILKVLSGAMSSPWMNMSKIYQNISSSRPLIMCSKINRLFYDQCQDLKNRHKFYRFFRFSNTTYGK